MIKQSSSHRAPPREITLPSRGGYQPANQFAAAAAARKTISSLMESKWEIGYNLLNRKLFRAKGVCISLDKGWFYLGFHNCTTKLVGDNDDHWCPSCRDQIPKPFPRYLLRLEVEDSTGCAIFVVMDNEVQKLFDLPASDAVALGEELGVTAVKASFEPLIGVFHDYHIMINPYNMKKLGTQIFTVSKFPIIYAAVRAQVSSPVTATIIEINPHGDVSVAVGDPPVTFTVLTYAAAGGPVSATITDINPHGDVSVVVANPHMNLTLSKLPSTGAAAIAPMYSMITEIKSQGDTSTGVDELPLKKPCLDKMTEQNLESIPDKN